MDPQSGEYRKYGCSMCSCVYVKSRMEFRVCARQCRGSPLMVGIVNSLILFLGVFGEHKIRKRGGESSKEGV